MLRKKSYNYLTWGCADELAARLRKTLYCGEETGCYDSSSTAALTDMAVSMYLALTTSPRRKLTHRYASSLTRQLSISPCSLMMGIIYSQRLQLTNPKYLEHVSSSDLFVVSMLVANKVLVDEGEHDEIFNDDWAEAAGLAVSTVNRLEREFLTALDWNAYVNPGEFLEFCSDLETRIALKHGLLRGWFSYTDLTQFLLAQHYQKALKAMLESTVKVISSCALLYGFSLSLLASSIMCYTSPSQIVRSPTRLTSVNQTQSNAAVNVDTIGPFAERDLSRPRRVVGEMRDARRGSGVTEDVADIRQSTFTIAGTEEASRNLVANASAGSWRAGTECRCSIDPDPCFEVSFGGALRQTQLSWDFNLLISDHLARQSCVSWMRDRDRVGWGCGCGTSAIGTGSVWGALTNRLVLFGLFVS